MSDSLPTISADQLTKAVNLAAAGTLTALDGETDDEDRSKDKTLEHESPNKGKEPSSPLSTLKLLEVLSSSMTPNLSRLRQLDIYDPPPPAAAIQSNTGGVTSRGRQRNPRPSPVGPAPSGVRKYSNRKNYKLLPPVIPEQIGTGVRKAKPFFGEQKQRLMALGSCLKPACSSEVLGLQVRPGRPGLVVLSPSNLSRLQNKPGYSEGKPPVTQAMSALKVSTSQPPDYSDRKAMVFSPLPHSTLGPEIKVTMNSQNSKSYPHSNVQSILKQQLTLRGVQQQHQLTSENQRIVIQNLKQNVSSTKSIRDSSTTTTSNPILNLSQFPRHGAVGVIPAAVESRTISDIPTEGQINSGPNSGSQSSFSSHKSQTSPAPLTATPSKRTGAASTTSSAGVGKTVYVPILPQPAATTTSGTFGQLVIQNSLLQMVHPDGSVQTIAILQPPLLDSKVNTNQSVKMPGLFCTSAESPVPMVPPGERNSHASIANITPPPPFTSDSSDQGTAVVSSNSYPMSSKVLSTTEVSTNISKSQAVPISKNSLPYSTVNSTPKTVLATVIPAPQGILNAQKSCPAPSLTSTAQGLDLQDSNERFLPKQLASKGALDCKELSVVFSHIESNNETVSLGKQPGTIGTAVSARQSEIPNNTFHTPLLSLALLKPAHDNEARSQGNVCSSSSLTTKTQVTSNLHSDTNKPDDGNTMASISSQQVVKPTLLSQEPMPPAAQQTLSKLCVSQTLRLLSPQQSPDLKRSVTPESTAMNENASATAVAAAAMMSLAQTADPRCIVNEPCTKLVSKFGPEAHPLTHALPKTSYSSVPPLRTNHCSMSPMSLTPDVCSKSLKRRQPQADSSSPKAAESISLPQSTKGFSGEFLVPSLCGKKMIVSPGGIKHLQSLLRQRGISEGYFVITSPRAIYNNSSATFNDKVVMSPAQEKTDALQGKSEENVNSFPKYQIAISGTSTSVPGSSQKGGNEAKTESNDEEKHNKADPELRSEENTECEDSDKTSCSSRSSSAALVIETGEDDEKDREDQSSGTSGSVCSHNQRLSDEVMPNASLDKNCTPLQYGSRMPEVSKGCVAAEIVSPDEPVLDRIHDSSSCIPQSPLSLSDLVRQQANRNPVLNKLAEYAYLKSPDVIGRDGTEAFRAPSENNSFALPMPVSRALSSSFHQAPQSTMDSDLASDDRQNVFTPSSMYPVDLSYERDSQLASMSCSEPVNPSSPPKAVSSTNVASPKSPFLVSSSMADHATPLNPPMTPNTMLINLLNRVPTPLLTNNQDILTLPTSQESRTFEISAEPKPNRSVQEKRAEHMFSDKAYAFAESQEYSDNLPDEALFSDTRKSSEVGQDTFGPPQNALEVIASNYTSSGASEEHASRAVTHEPTFPIQSMSREPVFIKSSFSNDHNIQEEFSSTYHEKLNSQKACQESMSCCEHLLVTVNLDSDTPALAVPVPHSDGHCIKASQPFTAGHSDISCSQHCTHLKDNLQGSLGFPSMERTPALQYTGKSSADTNLLRHLIMSTSAASYHGQSAMENHTSDLLSHQQEQSSHPCPEHQTLSHLSCRDNPFLNSQGRELSSGRAQTEQDSTFSDHAERHYSHSAQTPSQTPCTFSDSSMTYKKAEFHCRDSNSQISSSSTGLHEDESALGSLQNVPYIPEMQGGTVGRCYNITDGINKPDMTMSHNFMPTEEHMQQLRHESEVYFNHSHHQMSLQTIRQEAAQHFDSSDHQGLGSFEHEQNIQGFGATNQPTNLQSVYEESSQSYEPTGQQNLETFDQTGSHTGLQVYNQSDHQHSGMQEFNQSDDRPLHSFHASKEASAIQSYEQHPDPSGLSYNMESLPPAAAAPPPAAPPSHPYPSSSLSHQESSRMFASHPDQVNYLVNQQYPPPQYFTSSTSVGAEAAVPAMFPEQCAIGSEAPVLGTGNSHPCNASYSGTPQELSALQHLPQPYSYSANQGRSERVAEHQQPGPAAHEDAEGSSALDKQPVLPSASFSPPSVADQAANQAAAVTGGHQYSGAFPNLSIYDLYLRGSSAEARGGPNEVETLSGNFCVECNTMYKTQCKFHSCDYTYVTDTPILSHARLTLPGCLLLKESTVIGHTNNTGVFAKETIAMRTKFGPLTGSPVSCDQLGSTRSFSLWQTFLGGSVKVMDTCDENSSNWLMFVKPARVSKEQNLVAFQHGHSVYFVTRQEIKPQQELLYWFAKDYARILGIADKSKSGQHMLCPHCTICKQIFPDRKELRSHLRVQHPRPCNKQCSQCSKRFSQVSHLKAHIASVHSQVKKFVCTQCGKRFSDGSNFKKHTKLHTKERAYKCQLCGRDFRQKSHLKSHMNTHMPVKNEQCGFCGERFTRAFTRRQHELQHTKQNKIQCEHCGKIFYKQKIYKHHLKIHRDERNYPCLQCHRAFRTRANLLRHGPACKQRKCLSLPPCPPPPPPPPPASHLPSAFPPAPPGSGPATQRSSLLTSLPHPSSSNLHELSASSGAGEDVTTTSTALAPTGALT